MESQGFIQLDMERCGKAEDNMSLVLQKLDGVTQRTACV